MKDGVPMRHMPRIAAEPFMRVVGEMLLVTSPYAVAEAERNLSRKRPEALEGLAALLAPIEMVDSLAPIEESGLPAKDVPILAAAVAGTCQVLLTADVKDFGHVIGQIVQGVRVLTPSMLLAEIARGQW